MGYEYKEEILLDIGPEPNCNYGSESNRYYDKIEELDQVYTQATKADDYEAKAEALDAIMREWEDERMTKSHILETIQMYYNKYESGELDA